MVQKFNRTHNRDVDKVSFGALSALQSYAWPGNIRELENVIEHAFIMERGNEISLNSLPDHIKQSFGKKTVDGATVVDAATVAPETIRIDVDHLQASMKFDTDNLNFPDLKEKFEKEFLVKALQTYGGKINKTAEKTRMTKVTLLRKNRKIWNKSKRFSHQLDYLERAPKALFLQIIKKSCSSYRFNYMAIKNLYIDKFLHLCS